LGRYADAKARCAPLLEFAPNYFGAPSILAMADLLQGNFEAARPMIERWTTMVNPSAKGQAQELVEALAGRGDKRALALRYAALPLRSDLDPASGHGFAGFETAVVLMLLGERELTLGYLERLAVDLGSDVDWALMLPVMDPIRCDPRFVAIIQRLKTTDPYAATVCGEKH
jgi:hypothetical protein